MSLNLRLATDNKRHPPVMNAQSVPTEGCRAAYFAVMSSIVGAAQPKVLPAPYLLSPVYKRVLGLLHLLSIHRRHLLPPSCPPFAARNPFCSPLFRPSWGGFALLSALHKKADLNKKLAANSP